MSSRIPLCLLLALSCCLASVLANPRPDKKVFIIKLEDDSREKEPLQSSRQISQDPFYYNYNNYLAGLFPGMRQEVTDPTTTDEPTVTETPSTIPPTVAPTPTQKPTLPYYPPPGYHYPPYYPYYGYPYHPPHGYPPHGYPHHPYPPYEKPIKPSKPTKRPTKPPTTKEPELCKRIYPWGIHLCLKTDAMQKMG